MTDLSMFVGALALVYLLPGADMMLVLNTAATVGRRRALIVAAGLALARSVHVALAGLGLATLLATRPAALGAAHLLGGLYLIRLAVVVARTRFAAAAPAPAAAPRPDGETAAATFRTAAFTNLSNPKALLFCSLLLPQFVDPSRDVVALRFALLGAILVAVGFAFDAAYAGAGGLLRRLVAGDPRADLVRRIAFSGLLGGLGLQLVAAGLV